MKGIHVRAYILGFVGLVLSLYSLNNGQGEWLIGVNGPFTKPPRMRLPHYTLSSYRKVVVGLGTLPAIVSASVSLLLLLGVLTSTEKLLIPSLVYHLSDLVNDVSTVIVTCSLIYSKLGTYAAISYVSFISTVLAINLYLWIGVVKLYEQCCRNSSPVQPAKGNKLLEFSPLNFSKPMNMEDEPPKTAADIHKQFLEEYEEFLKAEAPNKLNESGKKPIIETKTKIKKVETSF